MSAPELSSAALLAAFALALARARAALPAGEPGTRIAAALALGALFAHLGWAALHAGSVAAAPWALLDPTRGFCALFVPLGALLAAPREPARRAAHLGALLPALPLALALARLGCLAAGCCHGVDADGLLGWPIGPGGARVHPTPLYEAAGLVGVHAIAARARAPRRAGLALAGLGAVRLAVEPFRASPPLGAPALPAAWLAAATLALGLALAARPRPVAG